jgi:hypothetical protein
MHHLLRRQEEESNQDEHPHAQERELLSPALECAHRPSPRQGARGSKGQDEKYEWGQEREGQDSGYLRAGLGRLLSDRAMRY